MIAAAIATWRLAVVSKPSAIGSHRRGAAVAHPPTLTLRIVGAATPIQAFNPGGACPDGKFSFQVQSGAGQTIGTDFECDLADAKVDKPNWGVWSTQTVIAATYKLPGGTILTEEQRTFHFSRQTLNSHNPIKTRASIAGRIIGGSGRYTRVRGSISGSGLSLSNNDNWTVTFRFH